MQHVRVVVPAPFLPHAETALVRLGYLYPSMEWSFDNDSGCLVAAIEGDEFPAAELRKEILFQLYREKIQHDTASIRRQIYEAIQS